MCNGMKLVYLSPVPWSSITQRPHFFIDVALKKNVESVLWIDPYPTRYPTLRDFSPERHAPEPIGMGLPERVKVVKLGFTLPCEPIPFIFKIVNYFAVKNILNEIEIFIDASTVLIIGKPSLVAVSALQTFRWKETWYDAMDDFPAFYRGMSKNNMQKTENTIVSLVDKIFCSSHALQDKFALPQKTTLIPNACSENSVRVDVKKKDNKIIFGYVGTVAQWFDWPWVISLSKLNPDALIRIIGPIKTALPDNLPKNIVLEHPIEHTMVMETIATFDVAIIPFILNDLTKCVDPVKFYEYLLAGKDIISTPFGEMHYHYSKFKSVSNIVSYCVPEGTLIFPVSQLDKNYEVPRWNDRFQPLFCE